MREGGVMRVGDLRRGGEQVGLGLLGLSLQRDDRFQNARGRGLAGLRRFGGLLTERGEPGFEIGALLMRDEPRLAEIDSEPLRDIVDPGSEEHTSELQSLMRNSYAVFCLKKKKKTQN